MLFSTKTDGDEGVVVMQISYITFLHATDAAGTQHATGTQQPAQLHPAQLCLSLIGAVG